MDLDNMEPHTSTLQASEWAPLSLLTIEHPVWASSHLINPLCNRIIAMRISLTACRIRIRTPLIITARFKTRRWLLSRMQTCYLMAFKIRTNWPRMAVLSISHQRLTRLLDHDPPL